MGYQLFNPDWSQIYERKALGPWSLLMAFFSILYGWGVRLRLRAYKQGLFRRKSLPGSGRNAGSMNLQGMPTTSV